MIKIKIDLEELKDDNKLKEFVINHYINMNYDNDVELLEDMENLQKYGCISGMIPELIYYDDTNKFYDEYKDDINKLLSDTMQNTGLSIEELFGEKYDKEDPLIVDCFNKNLMAWFGFEETSYQLYEQLYEKVYNNNYSLEN